VESSVSRPKVIRMLRDVAPPWLLTRALLLLITVLYAAPRSQWPHWQAVVLTAVLPDPQHPHNFLSPSPSVSDPLVNMWYRWDAAWYLRVAGNGPDMGYTQRFTENKDHNYGAFAFFPLYPLIVRAVALAVPGASAPVSIGATPHPQLVMIGLIVANVTFVLTLLALYLFVTARAGPATARRTIWLLCVFPTTVIFSAPYSESLFLLWLVLFFLALGNRRWWVAGACGALASATRSNGALLALPYLVAWGIDTLSRDKYGIIEGQEARGVRSADSMRVDDGRLTWFWKGTGRAHWLLWLTSLAPVMLIPLGLLGYMAYQWASFGDPFLFQEAQKAWSRTLAPPWVGLVDGIKWTLISWPHLTQPQWRGLTDVLYALVFLLLTALAWHRTDWTGRTYSLVFWAYVLCLPNVSDPKYPDTLISTPRFLLALVPLWIWLGRSRRRTALVMSLSTPLLLAYAIRWVNGGWIG